MGNIPELIVMLTKNDMTVANAVQVFEEAKDAPAKFWGFKEVGIPKDEMKHLVRPRSYPQAGQLDSSLGCWDLCPPCLPPAS